MLNCKVGDLAIVIKSTAGNEGKIVQCLKFVPNKQFLKRDCNVIVEDSWIVDSKLKTWNGRPGNAIPDAWLKPIRNQDGEDEMLKIVGYPKVKEKETV